MYGTCGRIDNKADFDFFDFDNVYVKVEDVKCSNYDSKKIMIVNIAYIQL